MASRQPPKSYDETTLQALEQALRDVWQVLTRMTPFVTGTKMQIFGGDLQKLMDLADAGVTEPQEFRSRVLASCDLKPLQ